MNFVEKVQSPRRFSAWTFPPVLILVALALMTGCRGEGSDARLESMEQSVSQLHNDVQALQAQVKDLQSKSGMTDQTTQVMTKAIQAQRDALNQMDTYLQKLLPHGPINGPATRQPTAARSSPPMQVIHSLPAGRNR